MPYIAAMEILPTLELQFQDASQVGAKKSPLAWHGFRVEHVLLTTDEGYDFRAKGDSCYLAYHELMLTDGELKMEGLPTLAKTQLRDTLTFAPEGCAIEGWAKPARGENSYTALYFEPDIVSEELGERYACANAAPFAYVRNAGLASTMIKLRDLAVRGDDDPLYAEALCLSATIELLGMRPSREAAPLSKAQLARIQDFIFANQHRAIGLDELADVVDLSRSHFSRAFKATTGVGPYRFVSDWRVRRAQEMLRAVPDQSVESIAQAVGFASAGAFRRVFQQFAGTTPKQYRRQQR
ncbi:helix-turn-helix transcriptional regulator [Sphingobium fuliginis ATCC 27551]|uniref:Helix-turn-helix transcriptional regulator n=2 Tax=Sphingobium fuliginis (strain ATCC 27551) TaxID=336203 RepID=A0A5B8CEA9_SPHSA|nr:helix-turn-helix transcriptional regulator [Sphingobium fuliginis ATCC 27551]